MDALQASRVLVVGLARSGVAAARLAAADGAAVRVTDERSAAELAATLEALPPHSEAVLGGHPESCLEGVELVVASPGVWADAPLLAAARRRGLRVLTEIEYAWLHRPEAPLAAVTGSNGKSTVTTLIAEMLGAAGHRVAAGGNLEPPASQLVLEGGWDSWVLELSSFQTELLTALRPRAAVFLNLSQDHLERHPGLAAYRDAKRRLFAFQGSDDAAILNAEDEAVASTPVRGRRRLFALDRSADAHLADGVLWLEEAPLLAADEVAISGRHNLANALAAALAAREMGAAREAVADALRRFPGLPHRHRTVHEADGVRWVDDSKATNVGSAVAALPGYPPGSVHLILGGLAKGQDFTPLRHQVEQLRARVYLIGRDAAVIAEALAGAAPLEDCGALAEAVARARRHARAGDTVLLAPACASFDQFSGYAERGDVFTRLARGEER